MKKFIVLIMALITIFSASVTTFASSGSTGYYADWAIVDTILNLQQGSQNCTLVKYNTARPTPSMVDGTGAIKTQKTTYNVLHALYETVTVEGANWSQNIWSSGTFHWYVYGDYCWIRYNPDSDSGIGWVANYQGKILYCDAPVEETTYTISAIAGATGYCLTNRPAGTTGNGYLGDLLVTQDNLTTIHGVVDGLGGDADYYMVLRIVNGEYRYYIMCTYPNRQQYFVCNTSGQLFYALRDEVTDDGGDTGGGSTFDPTEVITAINSVYSAINSMNSNLGTRLANILNATNGIGVSVENLAANVVTGFTGVQEQLSTLNSYFTDLSGLFPVQETITLLGSDTRVAWDSADRITNVTTSGFNGDLIVKERAGDLVDESGYEKVTINETEYSLYNDTNGYRRIKANNEYEGTGSPIPDGSLFYFPFDNTLSSSVGDLALTYYDGTSRYADGISGDAFVFDGNGYLASNKFELEFSNANDRSFTFSFWVNISEYPVAVGQNPALYELYVGSSLAFVGCYLNGDGSIEWRAFGSTYIDESVGTIPLNSWTNLSFTCAGSTLYCFLNGQLEATFGFSPVSTSQATLVVGAKGSLFSAGSMIDEFIFVNGTALWTTSYDAEKEAVFSQVAQDYFLPCDDQSITINFYDTYSEQVTEHRWNQYTINTSRLPDGYTELDSIQSSGTQYINTGVIGKTGVSASFTFDLLSANESTFLGSYGNSQRFYLLGLSGSSFYYAYGNLGTLSGFTPAVGTRYTVTSSFLSNSQTVEINGTTVLNATSSSSINTGQSLYLFANNVQGNLADYSSITLYSCQIYDNGILVRDFVPCKNPSNAVGLYDLVSGQFYGNSGTGSFTAGAEVSNGSGIGQLVGVVSSTNANAYPNDGIQGDFYYEYIGAFTEYPFFSQTLSPTDVNGNAITMGRLEDDFSEIYMDISTMMWYCHDPQTQTEILLSSANQEIMNDTIYVRQNYTILPADQITADALQNLLPVDSPVYLDMPEGAKLTITYDHYTGWFRMMYILMDKQTKLLSDLDIVNETIINVENTVIDITNSNPAYNVFYITKTDGTTESVGDAAKDAAVFVGDILSMFYRLVFDDALDNVDILKDFEGAYSNTEVSVW